MAKEMLINVSAGEECRIALLENNKLEELYMERTSATSHVGNIYKGKVTNVEPSIQAAFVDFGIGRNGFLHISDLMPSYFGGKKGSNIEPVGRKLSRRDRPPIQQCLRKGDEIVVQIIKEGIGTKGPTLSTYLSVPGRVLVMMPGMSKMGVSKKIEDEEERIRLRKILDGLKPPKDCGFIIRTAGIGKSKVEIERDLKYLARLWETLKKKIDHDKPPVELYTEGDLVTRTVRDVFTSDVDAIIVDDKETAKKIKDFIKLAMPRTKNKVQTYEEQVPLFHKYEIEEVIEGMYSRRVPLPSGGSLIIDQTEAVVAIDVNSGKFRDHSDAETTAYKTDMEAADEIPRQLRLRDMGGVIICDFIDLRFDRHRRDVEQRLFDNMKNDRAKTRMLRMSQFGIIEMTRQRMRPSLKKSIYQECESCRGQGMVKTPESMALDAMRKLRIGLDDAAVARVQLAVHPDVAAFLLNKKRSELAVLEEATHKRIVITHDEALAMDEVKFELYDARDGYIFIAELGMALPAAHQQSRAGAAPAPRERSGRGDRDRQRNKPKHDRRDEESLDAEELYTEEETDASPKSKAAAPKRGKVEETGNDDEATVVDVDDGGDATPGNAPDGFFDANENPRQNDRNRRGNRRGGRGGGHPRDIRGTLHDGPRQNQRNGQPAVRPDSDPSDGGPSDADPSDAEASDEMESDEIGGDASRDSAPEADFQGDREDNRQRPDAQRGGPREGQRDGQREGQREGQRFQNRGRDQQGGRRQEPRIPPGGQAPGAPGADGDAPVGEGANGDEGPRRRRRRRGGRGRRGRGKDGQNNGPNNGPNNVPSSGPNSGSNNGPAHFGQNPALEGLPSDEELDAETAAIDPDHIKAVQGPAGTGAEPILNAGRWSRQSSWRPPARGDAGADKINSPAVSISKACLTTPSSTPKPQPSKRDSPRRAPKMAAPMTPARTRAQTRVRHRSRSRRSSKPAPPTSTWPMTSRSRPKKSVVPARTTTWTRCPISMKTREGAYFVMRTA